MLIRNLIRYLDCKYREGDENVNWLLFNKLKISVNQIQNVEGIIFQEKGIYDTLGTGTDAYFSELNYRYKIKTIEDVKSWGKTIRKLYFEYAIPFFENYNTLMRSISY